MVASQTPLVTTVIPAYNAERFLGEAIESSLEQDYPAQEVIVVDDGSEDRTAEVAEGYEGVRLMRQPNQGPAAARNTAIAAARGESIALLDADDRMASGRLRKQVGYLLEHPEAAVVLGLQELLMEPGVEVLPGWAGAGRGPLDPSVGPPTPFSGAYAAATVVAWRTAYEAVGNYDVSLRYGEDVDWLLRVMEAGMTVGTFDEVVLLRRLHGENMTYDQEAMRHGLFAAFKRRIDRRRAAGSAPDSE
jgi:glycosyltransferase involved in cell wall biosynthesis